MWFAFSRLFPASMIPTLPIIFSHDCLSPPPSPAPLCRRHSNSILSIIAPTDSVLLLFLFHRPVTFFGGCSALRFHGNELNTTHYFRPRPPRAHFIFDIEGDTISRREINRSSDRIDCIIGGCLPNTTCLGRGLLKQTFERTAKSTFSA